MKKKLFCVTLLISSLLLFTGCGGKDAGKDPEQGAGGSSAVEETVKEAPYVGSEYFYNQFTAEEKAFYDQLRKQSEDFYNGSQEPKKLENGYYVYGSFDQGTNGFTIEYGVLKSYAGTDDTIVIPESVMEIDAVVFNVDHEVQSFEVDENNPCFCAVDGVLYSKDKKTLVCYPKARKGAYKVIDGTKKIADRAFLYNRGVTELELPEGLEVIGAGSLLFCEGITKMNLPDSLQNIGFQSMGGAHFLDGRIVLPKNLTELYGYAFMNSGMTEVVVSDGITLLLDDLFLGCSALKTVYLPAGITYVGPNVFEGCTSLKDIYFAGSEEQWNALDTSSAQIPSDCTIHFE